VVKNETPDGTELTAKYTGNAGWLTINWTAKQYIHKVVVYNVNDFPEKNTTTGYYEVPAGDAAAFILTLAMAESGDKIFLPNGIYDLGETVLTTISKNNIAIIGQSMEGTIIKNAPDVKTESIDKTATIKINDNISGTYLQDLTIQNALDYYKSDNGRAVCLWDRGTQTVCKNVRLLSYQDTYYSNKNGAVYYFEDCEIHGTVDFICGGGSAYFKNNLLYCEKRKAAGGGSDCITASNADAADFGYAFEGCTIKSECPVVSFGRAWNNTPMVTFINTLVDYSAGEFSFTDGSKIQRWTKELMNPNAWPIFGEYNTHLADGTILTPASNVVTFIDTKSANATQDKETVLTESQVNARTIANTLGEWGAKAVADATPAVCDLQNIEAEGIYLVEAENGNAMMMTGAQLAEEIFPDDARMTVRKANARGGFGEAVVIGGETAVEAVSGQQSAFSVQKVMRDGQLIIIRGGIEYNTIGQTIQ
jgi:NADH/NAD ratio-sensing transcriptional regulator Rex